MNRSIIIFLAGAAVAWISTGVFTACSSPPAEMKATISATPAPSATSESCDSAGFLAAAAEAEKLRVKRRVSAEEFARMAKEPGTIVLDARSPLDHEQLCVKGSVNLPYTAMAEESLRRVIPDTGTRILIYCRNNLLSDRPADRFPVQPKKAGSLEVLKEFPYPSEFDPPQIPKTFGAGLNIPTYITLYIYGYRNVYELNPVVDPNQSPIEFVSGR